MLGNDQKCNIREFCMHSAYHVLVSCTCKTDMVGLWVLSTQDLSVWCNSIRKHLFHTYDTQGTKMYLPVIVVGLNMKKCHNN